MSNLPLAFAETLAGGIILLAGLSGKSPGQVMQGSFALAPLASGSSNSTGTPGTGMIASLFPAGSKIITQRRDQGQDIQGPANSPIFANGDGVVINNGYNPGGFGASYPIVHFTSGPWAGLDVYFGHIQSAVSPGQTINQGTTLGITQNGTGPYAGNATVPGWVEVGLAPGGVPGAFGQSLPPGL